MNGMGWDKEKARLWYDTSNPLLGGMSPKTYEILKGTERLEKLVINTLEENNRKPLGE